jgi:Tfp pilus assembly protein PilF
LLEARDIATEIGDDSVRVATDIELADAYLSLNQADAARQYVEVARTERPEEAGSLKVQARYAAQSGDSQEAARLMSQARIRAGEGWTADDDVRLAAYRESAGVSDE